MKGAKVLGERFSPSTYQCSRCGRISGCRWDQKPLTCAACALPAATGLPDQSWADQALCAQTDPDVWFPPIGGRNDAAKAICAACPVTAECLAYALESGQEEGIWGGTSAVERRHLREVS
jgi:WhiB family redox-sensing transcriptional regulator